MTDKKFNMADLTTSLLAGEVALLPAPGKPQAGQQEAEAPADAPVVSGAAQPPARKRPEAWRTLRPPGQPSDRERMREVRAHAEAWYQALREWRVFESEPVRIFMGPAKTSRMRVVGIAMGSGPGDSYLSSMELVSLPNGAHRSATVAAYCNSDPLLGRIRAGGGLASLVDERGGWNRDKAAAVVYAQAVLRLAVSLGDGRAKIALGTLLAMVD